MIYEYDKKNKIVKVNDRTVYLTEKEDKIFKKCFIKDGELYVSFNEINEILFGGYGQKSIVKTFVTKLSNKLGIKIEKCENYYKNR